jgi:hypothetical protein
MGASIGLTAANGLQRSSLFTNSHGVLSAFILSAAPFPQDDGPQVYQLI